MNLAAIYSCNEGIYFTKFPGIELEKCVQVICKTIREIRKDGDRLVPCNLKMFFNAQQRRKRFNLPPSSTITIDIYEKNSLKLIERYNTNKSTNCTTKDLVSYFNSANIIHIYDPNPITKDFVQKNGNLKDFLNIDKFIINSNISRFQGYQILNIIKNREIKCNRSETERVNLLNWKNTIPQMKDKHIGMRRTALHLALGIYKIKIGNQKWGEGYLISFNDKGPMVVFDGKMVECSTSRFQLELSENLIETDKHGIVPDKRGIVPDKIPKSQISLKPLGEKMVPDVSSIRFERKPDSFFTTGLVLPPEDEKANKTKKNSYHGEFKILNNFVNQLKLCEVKDKTEITGELFILSEKTPCYGCLDVVWNQFNEHFPNIELKYNFIYGIRVSENGFQKINLEIKNSPIIVPSTREERSEKFTKHSEFLLTNISSEDDITAYLSSFRRYNEMKKFIEKYSDFAEQFKRFNFPYDELEKQLKS
jgi:putative deaminase of polymorphic toxin system